MLIYCFSFNALVFDLIDQIYYLGFIYFLFIYAFTFSNFRL